jgi:hypothetical protein
MDYVKEPNGLDSKAIHPTSHLHPIFASIIDCILINIIPIIGFFYFSWKVSEEYFYFLFELLFLYILALILSYVKWKKYRIRHLLFFFQSMSWGIVVFFPILIIFVVNVYMKEYQSYKVIGHFLWQFRWVIVILLLNTIFFYLPSWRQYTTTLNIAIEKHLVPRLMVIVGIYLSMMVVYYHFETLYNKYYLSVAYFAFLGSKIFSEIWGIVFYKKEKREKKVVKPSQAVAQSQTDITN